MLDTDFGQIFRASIGATRLVNEPSAGCLSFVAATLSRDTVGPFLSDLAEHGAYLCEGATK
jgi:hypothetical protein